MRLTPRDIRVVRDIALSHVLCRDQIIELAYFTSVTRANTRLRELRDAGLVSVLKTPYFGQQLYVAGPRASDIVGERIGPILAARQVTPRFVQHALSTTNVRLHLLRHGASAWRFEQQIRSSFKLAGREIQIRPDGMALGPDGIQLVEVDLGHVNPAKFREKLLAYEAFLCSGCFKNIWNAEGFSVLTVTSGPLRATRLARLLPKGSPLQFQCESYEELGIEFAGGWS